MKRYIVKDKRVLNGILHLSIEPKHDRDKLKFYAGQYATIGFRAPNGRRSPMRCFSIVSSPLNNNILQFAIRVQGDFTEALSELPECSDMFVQGPFGEFVVDDGIDRNLVFLAGGIGITPCISIMRTLTLVNSRLPMTLLHSYKTADVPFKDELKILKRRNPNLKAYHFITQDPVPPEEFNVLSGVIRHDHIKQVTQGRYVGSTYFVCGPKSFMDKMSEMLIDNGVDEDRILTESFAQSSKIYAGNGFSIQKLTYGFASALLLTGIVGISFLDLSRYVPRVANADSRITTSTSAPATDNNSSASSTGSTITPSTNYSNTGATSSQVNSTPTPSSSYSSNNTQTYQAPVTSVS